MRNLAVLHNSFTYKCDMGARLQDNIGQKTKERHCIPLEQQGTSLASQKQLLKWEPGQPPTANSYPYKRAIRPLDCSSILFQRWGTSKHTMSLNILGY